MPINVKTASPHDEAAANIETEVTGEKHDLQTGEASIVEHSHAPAQADQAAEKDFIEVGMAFKMPVAQYTMLEFTVRRRVHFDPLQDDDEDVYAQTKEWVEGKINALIAEQQEPGA